MANNIALYNGSSGFRVDLTNHAPVYLLNIPVTAIIRTTQ